MTHLPFVVLEIEADDLQRASDFYTCMFGWKFGASAAEPGALETEMTGDHDTRVRVHLRKRSPDAAAPARREDVLRTSGHSLCVHDLGSVLGRVLEAGGEVIAGPIEVQGLGRRLYVRDTEGNAFAVLEPIHFR